MPDDKKYDDSNRIALWHPKDERRKGYYTGYGNFDGQKVYDAVLVVRDKQGDKLPFADLWWRTEGLPRGSAFSTPIYNNDGKLGGQHEGFWVNAFKNKEKGPPVVITFKEKEQRQERSGGQAPPDEWPTDDDIPF